MSGQQPIPDVSIPTYNDVTRHNLLTLSLSIRHCIQKATFIAIDTEFTGLGSGKTRSQDLRDRFQALSKVVNEHALVAFGLTTFEQISREDEGTHYVINNFNFILLSTSDYKVSAESMCFLVDNGFDFNRQFRDGIPYAPGNDHANGAAPNSAQSTLRDIFDTMLSRKIPIVVHNGLFDIMFMYRAFHAAIPEDLDIFIADLADMFPGGLYDTKYVADYVTRETSSFLAYVFRKYEREQEKRKRKNITPRFTWEIMDRLVSVEETGSPKLALGTLKKEIRMSRNNDENKRKRKEDTKPYCSLYAAHGVCENGRFCEKTHDLDYILNYEASGGKGFKAHKKVKLENSDSAFSESQEISEPLEPTPLPTPQLQASHTAATPISSISETPQNIFETYHSAGFDAYMTGFIFCHQLICYPTLLEDHKNKIYLIGKQRPLLIEKSTFAKMSDGHLKRKKVSGMF
ncbi:ribonuclease CAF1 [Chytridium lagenaria]|nr:ribonuclease CAF1 [Chytridium lagenaria]